MLYLVLRKKNIYFAVAQNRKKKLPRFYKLFYFNPFKILLRIYNIFYTEYIEGGVEKFHAASSKFVEADCFEFGQKCKKLKNEKNEVKVWNCGGFRARMGLKNGCQNKCSKWRMSMRF